MNTVNANNHPPHPQYMVRPQHGGIVSGMAPQHQLTPRNTQAVMGTTQHNQYPHHMQSTHQGQVPQMHNTSNQNNNNVGRPIHHSTTVMSQATLTNPGMIHQHNQQSHAHSANKNKLVYAQGSTRAIPSPIPSNQIRNVNTQRPGQTGGSMVGGMSTIQRSNLLNLPNGNVHHQEGGGYHTLPYVTSQHPSAFPNATTHTHVVSHQQQHQAGNNNKYVDYSKSHSLRSGDNPTRPATSTYVSSLAPGAHVAYQNHLNGHAHAQQQHDYYTSDNRDKDNQQQKVSQYQHRQANTSGTGNQVTDISTVRPSRAQVPPSDLMSELQHSTGGGAYGGTYDAEGISKRIGCQYWERLMLVLDARPFPHQHVLDKPQVALNTLIVRYFNRSVGERPTSFEYVYKLTGLLQSAIYGGVYKANQYFTPNLIRQLNSSSPNARSMKPHPHREVAIKIMLRAIENKHKTALLENIQAERTFGQRLRGHKNVLTPLDDWERHSKGYICVVMELAEFEDLFEFLKKRSSPLDEPQCRWLFKQIMEGAKFINDRDVAFRDHSLENILLFRDPKSNEIFPRITDPGQAIVVKRDNYGNVMPERSQRHFGKSFRPPEVYTQTYDPFKVDSFCIGWMLFYCLTKRQCFDRALDSDPHWPAARDGNIQSLLNLKNTRVYSPEIVDLLRKLLHPQSRMRPYFDEALEHPWFQGRMTPLTVQTAKER